MVLISKVPAKGCKYVEVTVDSKKKNSEMLLTAKIEKDAKKVVQPVPMK